MTPDLPALRALAARLDSATGPDQELDNAIYIAFWEVTAAQEPGDYTASLDACEALMLAVLPGWTGQLTLHSARTCGFEIWPPNFTPPEYSQAGVAPTAPLAWLRAIVAAKIAEVEG